MKASEIKKMLTNEIVKVEDEIKRLFDSQKQET